MRYLKAAEGSGRKAVLVVTSFAWMLWYHRGGRSWVVVHLFKKENQRLEGNYGSIMLLIS